MTAQIINRAEAKARGLKRYFTGKPCKFGHVCERYTAQSGCLACNREERKKSREKNPEKEASRRRDWYLKNKERHRELGRRWAQLNPEKRRASNQACRDRNRPWLDDAYREKQKKSLRDGRIALRVLRELGIEV